MLLSAEVGSNSHPFTPLADGDYHELNARVQYRARTFRIMAAANAIYNACGVRIREHPITKEKILAGLRALKQKS